jgi:hypothetical protein
MKEAADVEKFKYFAGTHRRLIYQKMLTRVRRQCGDPHWAPTGVLSGGGLWFHARVDEQLRKLYCRRATLISSGTFCAEGMCKMERKWRGVHKQFPLGNFQQG